LKKRQINDLALFFASGKSRVLFLWAVAVEYCEAPRDYGCQKSKHSQCLGVRIVAGFERVGLMLVYREVSTAIK